MIALLISDYRLLYNFLRHHSRSSSGFFRTYRVTARNRTAFSRCNYAFSPLFPLSNFRSHYLVQLLTLLFVVDVVVVMHGGDNVELKL